LNENGNTVVEPFPLNGPENADVAETVMRHG
jgi:hypothetical protein